MFQIDKTKRDNDKPGKQQKRKFKLCNAKLFRICKKKRPEAVPKAF